MQDIGGGGANAQACGFTDAVVRLTQDLNWDGLAPDGRAAALRHLIDTTGVMIAGASRDVAAAVEPLMAEMPDGIAIAGTPRRLAPGDAAFLAGTAAHGLELDDGYRQGSFHPGVVVLPTLIAACHMRKAGGDVVNGRQALSAFVAGYEVGTAIAESCHPAIRQRGFHPTSAVGTIAAAVTAGRILKLSDAQLASAIGMAASASAGLFAFVHGGADVKRLHAGQAARGGLQAAQFAQLGLAGPANVLSAASGFAQAFAYGDEVAIRFQPVLPPEHPPRIVDCYIKPHACCRHLHPAIDAVLEMRERYDIAADDIAAIHVETYGLACMHADTGWAQFAEAQMSFPYVLAAAALHGRVGLAEFDDTHRFDPRVATLAARMTFAEQPDMSRRYPAERPARVTITANGEAHTVAVDEALGARTNPLGEAGLTSKFLDLVEPVLGNEPAAALLGRLRAIADADDVSRVLDGAVEGDQ